MYTQLMPPLIALLVRDPLDRPLLEEAVESLERPLERPGNREAPRWMLASGWKDLDDYVAPRPERPWSLKMDALICLVARDGEKDFGGMLATRDQRPELALAPILAFIADASPIAIGRAYELGANAVLIKETSTEGWRRALHSVVDYWFGVARMVPVGNY